MIGSIIGFDRKNVSGVISNDPQVKDWLIYIEFVSFDNNTEIISNIENIAKNICASEG